MFAGGLRRWYNPPWYSESIPSTRYDPILLRESFEKARSELVFVRALVLLFVFLLILSLLCK